MKMITFEQNPKKIRSQTKQKRVEFNQKAF